MNAQLKPEAWPEDAAPDGRTGQISAALAKAQLEMSNPGFDSANPHFKNKFASLAAVRNAVVPLLAKHGIAMSQDLSSTDGTVVCTTILMHGSGQRLTFGPLILPVSKNDAQGFGSAATYARRYSLMAVAGVVGDDDDDANAATGKPAAAQGHDPRGDMGHDTPIAEVMKAAATMRDIMDMDVEEPIKALKVLDYHDVLNRDQDLYVRAADELGSKLKGAWKTYVSLAKAAQKADAAGSRRG
jgi:hypothetical protein